MRNYDSQLKNIATRMDVFQAGTEYNHTNHNDGRQIIGEKNMLKLSLTNLKLKSDIIIKKQQELNDICKRYENDSEEAKKINEYLKVFRLWYNDFLIKIKSLSKDLERLKKTKKIKWLVFS